MIGCKDHIRNLDFLTKSYLTVLCTVRINCWTYLNFSLTRAVTPAHTSQNAQDVKVASYRWWGLWEIMENLGHEQRCTYALPAPRGVRQEEEGCLS